MESEIYATDKRQQRQYNQIIGVHYYKHKSREQQFKQAMQRAEEQAEKGKTAYIKAIAIYNNTTTELKTLQAYYRQFKQLWTATTESNKTKKHKLPKPTTATFKHIPIYDDGKLKGFISEIHSNNRFITLETASEQGKLNALSNRYNSIVTATIKRAKGKKPTRRNKQFKLLALKLFMREYRRQAFKLCELQAVLKSVFDIKTTKPQLKNLLKLLFIDDDKSKSLFMDMNSDALKEQQQAILNNRQPQLKIFDLIGFDTIPTTAQENIKFRIAEGNFIKTKNIKGLGFCYSDIKVRQNSNKKPQLNNRIKAKNSFYNMQYRQVTTTLKDSNLKRVKKQFIDSDGNIIKGLAIPEGLKLNKGINHRSVLFKPITAL